MVIMANLQSSGSDLALAGSDWQHQAIGLESRAKSICIKALSPPEHRALLSWAQRLKRPVPTNNLIRCQLW